ncbi:hypothetical protein IE53DRAFT_155116 [Violaceomyces palustris]|uniref:Uncharacterized protein n=1 Tax=Violaceomyces palustris TaxID=1673888 RepID=A0ACD0NTZ1_9BASI|nr:hypothetical protein IE53DRAFT_155116 [Violaceomyces palustris]
MGLIKSHPSFVPLLAEKNLEGDTWRDPLLRLKMVRAVGNPPGYQTWHELTDCTQLWGRRNAGCRKALPPCLFPFDPSNWEVTKVKENRGRDQGGKEDAFSLRCQIHPTRINSEHELEYRTSCSDLSSVLSFPHLIPSSPTHPSPNAGRMLYWIRIPNLGKAQIGEVG